MVANIYSVLDIEEEETNNRVNAFKILSNKDKLKDELYKTKMCNRKNCDGINCNFAHNKSELRVRKCLFGDDCIYKNSKNKMCKFIHPCEDLKSYHERVSCIKIKKIIL